jgi:hypothetical protein
MEYEPTDDCPEGRLVVAYFEKNVDPPPEVNELSQDWASWPLYSDWKGLSQGIGRFLKEMGARYVT